MKYFILFALLMSVSDFSDTVLVLNNGELLLLLHSIQLRNKHGIFGSVNCQLFNMLRRPSIDVDLEDKNGSVSHVLMYHSKPTPEPCIARLCAEEHQPVCGKQKAEDCWEVKIFNSSCLMDSANDCGKANYEPCVENVCTA